MSKQSQLDECEAKKAELQTLYNGLTAEYAHTTIDLAAANARADNYYAQLQVAQDALAKAEADLADAVMQREATDLVCEQLRRDLATRRAGRARWRLRPRPNDD